MSRSGGVHLIAAGGWLFDLMLEGMRAELYQIAALGDSTTEEARVTSAVQLYAVPIASQAAYSRVIQEALGAPRDGSTVLEYALQLVELAVQDRARLHARGVSPLPGDEVLPRNSLRLREMRRAREMADAHRSRWATKEMEEAEEAADHERFRRGEA